MAGEDGDDVKPTMRRLQQNGIGSILAYSVENDVEAGAEPSCEADVEAEASFFQLTAVGPAPSTRTPITMSIPMATDI